LIPYQYYSRYASQTILSEATPAALCLVVSAALLSQRLLFKELDSQGGNFFHLVDRTLLGADWV